MVTAAYHPVRKHTPSSMWRPAFRARTTCTLIAIVALGFASSPLVTPSAAGVRIPRPQVSQLSATRTTIPGSGGKTRITARIEAATSCIWKVAWSGPRVQDQAFACYRRSSSSFLATDWWTLPKNTSHKARTAVVALLAYAIGGGPPSVRHIDITQAAETTPPTPVTRPTTTPLPATSPLTTTTNPSAPALPPGPWTSPNWSGYLVPSVTSPITDVGGQWTVPTLNCSATPNGGAYIWVGIGGDASTPLLQTGIETDCVNGAQQDQAWFEEVPNTPNQSYRFDNLPIAPGDTIKATVYQDASGNWDTRVDDLTAGLSGLMVTGEGWGVAPDNGDNTVAYQGTTTNLSYSGGYTAEWIVEDYASSGNGGSTVPFADYGTVNFTNLTTSLSQWHLAPDEQVEMVQNGTTLSTPSAPANNSFSVNYTG